MNYEWKILSAHNLFGWVWVNAGYQPYTSPFTNKFHWACFRCGETWLKRLPLENPEASILFRSSLCPSCGGGEIIQDRVHPTISRTADLHQYPTELLKREFLRMMGENVNVYPLYKSPSITPGAAPDELHLPHSPTDSQ